LILNILVAKELAEQIHSFIIPVMMNSLR